MQTVCGSSRKRKREGVFMFSSFCDVGVPADFQGPFRDNIHAFLGFARREERTLEGMKTWYFRLEVHHHSPSWVSLFVVEETAEGSPHSHCSQCKCIGWGHHLVCNKKFHFVLPSKHTSPVIEKLLQCSEKILVYPLTDSGENRPNATVFKSNKPVSFFDLHGHILHGVIHYNGFGHLLCVNGKESGSDLIYGSQVMDLWDRICTKLRARQISLSDTARKKSMDLRLLHGVAYGEPWFGKWGYRFRRGSFGVTHQMYQKSLDTIRTFRVSSVTDSLFISNPDLLAIVSKYQKLSSHTLHTLGQMFHHVMELKSHLPHDTVKIEHGVLPVNQCRWSSKRVEMATLVIVESLKNVRSKWVSRQQVRDAARAYIGDTGLLDFVLKSLGNQVIGNYVVRRAMNPVTRVLEYCLEEFVSCLSNPSSLSPNASKKITTKANIGLTQLELMRDLLYLYNTILRQFRPVSGLTRTILDAKHLIKYYNKESSGKISFAGSDKIEFLCTISISCNEEQTEDERSRVLQPAEIIPLPPCATISDMKREVEQNFREIYFGLRSFSAKSISEISAQDSDMVFGLARSDRNHLIFSGRIKEKAVMLYEGGIDERIVYCVCGAQEDDGERMVCCDVCEVWQHTRCVKISNSDEVPKIFLCNRCEHQIVLFPPLL